MRTQWLRERVECARRGGHDREWESAVVSEWCTTSSLALLEEFL